MNYWTFNVINIAMGKRLFILLSYSGNEISFNKNKKKETSLQQLTVLCGKLQSQKFVNGQFIKIPGFHSKLLRFLGLRSSFMRNLWRFLLIALKLCRHSMVDVAKVTLRSHRHNYDNNNNDPLFKTWF